MQETQASYETNGLLTVDEMNRGKLESVPIVIIQRGARCRNVMQHKSKHSSQFKELYIKSWIGSYNVLFTENAKYD